MSSPGIIQRRYFVYPTGTENNTSDIDHTLSTISFPRSLVATKFSKTN